MGMFDSVDVILDPSGRSPFLCAAGHNVFDFQTKDLNESMETYKIIGSRLYGPAPREAAWSSTFEMEGADLIEKQKRAYPPSSFTGKVVLYTSCPECDPVVYESAGNHWNGGVDTKQMWCEYEASFEQGLLVRVEGLKLETRDEVRKNHGLGVLPDDDRVAKKVLEQFRAKNR